VTGTKTAAFEKNCVLLDTAPKTNMEPENDHWEKEKHLYTQYHTIPIVGFNYSNKMDIKK